ncbi:hypothetical protein [Aliivibrio sp. 1S128]|uniref:hypothetical protein n=1 Tax=Aliivibrio sp. 1S128 TaxID=1840085 RepID=UPI00080DECA3|nr:hypothetical protein [Aliivibrio sp. 1S128]OCH11036.1 hypothetical protein A6E03_19135 [Aliivibrio sp. 1S128]
MQALGEDHITKVRLVVSSYVEAIQIKFKEVELNWSQLNQIKNIKMISSMYIWIFIVPIAAKVLSLTNEMATVTLFDYTFQVNLALPFSWRLFYFAALFFALATLIYQARCPRLIKEYSTFATFDNEGKPEWHLRPYAEDIGINYESFKDDLESSMLEHDGRMHKDKEYVQSVFWNLHWSADKKRRVSFLSCFACYVIGFVLISIVFFQNFAWVIKNISSTV